MLRQIHKSTIFPYPTLFRSGDYFYASTTGELKKVYDSLNSRLVFEKKEFEITAIFALIAALFSMLSAGLSVFWLDRKSTRLNSSHVKISYAVVCLTKKINV